MHADFEKCFEVTQAYAVLILFLKWLHGGKSQDSWHLFKLGIKHLKIKDLSLMYLTCWNTS